MSHKAVHVFNILFIYSLCVLAILTVAKQHTSGPFKTIPLGYSKCKDPVLPYTKQIFAEVYVAMKNTIVTGNYTVFKDIKNYKSSIQEYYYENGKRQLTFQVKKLTCHSRFHEYFTKAFGIKVDNKTCVIPKGVYKFSVDYNKMDHIWTDTREYGRATRRIETFTRRETISCYELEFKVRPKEK